MAKSNLTRAERRERRDERIRRRDEREARRLNALEAVDRAQQEKQRFDAEVRMSNRTAYRERVNELTNQQPLASLEHFGERSFIGGYHVDHGFSVYAGFRLAIDPSIISSMPNLQMLPCEENIEKGSRCGIGFSELMKLSGATLFSQGVQA